MMNDAGKVLLKPKGRYDSLTTYEILDCVTYNGNAYVAKKTTIGNLPTEDGEYWCILIENVEITPTFTIAQNLEELKSGEQYQITFGKIAKAVKDYILHKVAKATNTQLGHVKVTNSAAVTDSTGLALAATEKNAAIEGTLANLISQQNSNLYNKVSISLFNNWEWTSGTGVGVINEHLVSLNVGLKEGDCTANKIIAQLPAKYAPKVWTIVFAACGRNSAILLPFVIKTTGDIYCTQKIPEDYFVLNATWEI